MVKSNSAHSKENHDNKQPSGIFVIDKEVGLSTNAVIQRLKRKLDIKKIGHAGTLDPLASGVVIALANEATKLSDFLLHADKSYSVTMELFTSTTTYDAEGEVVQTDQPFPISKAMIDKVFKEFDGLTYNQIPPIFSAIKVNGKKLYDYARDKHGVEIKPRKVTIESLKFDGFTDKSISFRAKVSKGTYIRSLVVDLAKALETVAFVTKLRRLSSGPFDIKEAKPWENLEWADLIPLKTALEKSGQDIQVTPDLIRTKQGQKILLPNVTSDMIFLIDDDQQLLGCYERINQDEDLFRCKRGFNQ